MTLTMVLQVDCPSGQAIGVKEDLAMYCERFGRDVRVVSIEESSPEQMRIGGMEGRCNPCRLS